MYSRIGKRLLDTVLILAAAPLLLPLFLVITLFIKLESPGPVFFLQYRLGKNKVPFLIYKFRTMRADSPGDVPTRLLKNFEDHITGVGRILRRLSLDELPQLFNVLKGDISLVGPRPVLAKETLLIEERDKYGANDILPGITGLAQIRGRDALKPIAKARYDGEYARKLGFWLDVGILLLTLPVVVRGRGMIEGGTRIKRRKKK